VGSQYNSDELFMKRAKILNLAEMKLLKTVWLYFTHY
jgi:hypothetical protein